MRDQNSLSVALMRVRYEELRMECDELCVKARETQVEFWTEMAKPQPLLTRLHAVGTALEALAAQVESCYQRQLAVSPNSIQTLRRYAAFLSEVENSEMLQLEVRDPDLLILTAGEQQSY
jgi:hypothetical protein